MSDEDNGSSDDEVGYKRPPKYSRFKPGRSGNPSGKRKERKGPNFANTLQDVYAEIVDVSINGKPTSMTRREWVVETLGLAAANANVTALNRLLDLYDSEAPEEQEPQVFVVTEEEAKALGPG